MRISKIDRTRNIEEMIWQECFLDTRLGAADEAVFSVATQTSDSQNDNTQDNADAEAEGYNKEPDKSKKKKQQNEKEIKQELFLIQKMKFRQSKITMKMSRLKYASSCSTYKCKLFSSHSI